jgi:uncharacterized iron-regulated membrane protein
VVPHRNRGNRHPITPGAVDAEPDDAARIAAGDADAPIGLDDALRVLDSCGSSPATASRCRSTPRASGATLFPDDATHERVIHLDQYSGQPLIDVAYRDYGAVGKVTEWGIAVHTGRQYGLMNQLVMLAGCVAIVLLALSAVVMWWKRRPTGQLGAPQRRSGDRLAGPRSGGGRPRRHLSTARSVDADRARGRCTGPSPLADAIRLLNPLPDRCDQA